MDFDKHSVVIRAVMSADFDRITQLEKDIFSEPWSKESLRQFCEQDKCSEGYVCTIGDLIIGYAFVWIVMDELHIANIAVDGQYCGKGIGRILMEFILHRGKEAGAVSVYLEVRASNHRAINLYSSLGFQFSGIRKNYYSHPCEDAIIMSKELQGA